MQDFCLFGLINQAYVHITTMLNSLFMHIENYAHDYKVGYLRNFSSDNSNINSICSVFSSILMFQSWSTVIKVGFIILK